VDQLAQREGSRSCARAPPLILLPWRVPPVAAWQGGRLALYFINRKNAPSDFPHDAGRDRASETLTLAIREPSMALLGCLTLGTPRPFSLVVGFQDPQKLGELSPNPAQDLLKSFLKLLSVVLRKPRDPV
jgi:hypothetical protein